VSITPNRTPLNARTLPPEEVAIRGLRMLGLGLLAAVMVADALRGPLARWRALPMRIIESLDPPGSWLVEAVSDLLATSDGSGPAAARRSDT
jgi:hypothetical protein